MNKNSRIVITGATGFLGRVLVQTLLDNGFTNLCLLVRDSAKVEPWDVDVKQVELVDPHELKHALEGVDVLFHSAARVSFSDVKAHEIIEENVEMTSHIVDAAIAVGVKKIIYTSSIAALSGMKPGKIYIDESCTLDTFAISSPYAKSKFLCEQQIFRAESAGIKTIIVEPGVILGEGSQLLQQLSKGMPFYTMGITGFVDVKDVAKAQVGLAQSAGAEGEKFILVSENLSFHQVFDYVAEAYGRAKPRFKISKYFMRTIVAIELILYKIFGREPLMSRSSARASFAKNFYNGSKICNFIDFKYTAIQTTIKRSCKQQ